MVGRKEGKDLFDRGLSVQSEEEDWSCRWLVVDCRLEGSEGVYWRRNQPLCFAV